MFRDLVIKNRSFRGFDSSRSVSREELASFVDCARLSASSANMQPFKYYLAHTKEDTEKILALTKWAALLDGIKLPKPGKYPPAYIVICHDKNIAPSPQAFLRDVGIAAQTILLAAAEHRLGGCMLGNFSSEALSQALNLVPWAEPVLVIAIGKPDETVVITEALGGGVCYYRGEDGVHYVPKRSLKDIIL